MKVFLLYDGDEKSEKALIEIFSFACNELGVEFEHCEIYEWDRMKKKVDKKDLVFIDVGGLALLGSGNGFTVYKTLKQRIKDLSGRVKKVFLVSRPEILRYAVGDGYVRDLVGYCSIVDLCDKTVREIIDRETKLKEEK